MEFDNVIQNVDFIIELLNVIHKNCLMTFNGEYFQQFFLTIGTNVMPNPCQHLFSKTGKVIKR